MDMSSGQMLPTNVCPFSVQLYCNQSAVCVCERACVRMCAVTVERKSLWPRYWAWWSIVTLFRISDSFLVKIILRL